MSRTLTRNSSNIFSTRAVRLPMVKEKTDGISYAKRMLRYDGKGAAVIGWTAKLHISHTYSLETYTCGTATTGR